MNLRPSGYEPDELPDCSIPRQFLYKKYNYEIYLKYPKFNNVLSQLLLQEPEEKVKDNKDVLLAGLLANNLFYQSGNINNGGNENE